MDNYTCILIDDEPHALGALADIADKIPSLTIVGQYHDAMTAISAVKSLGKVDFIFSDIEMSNLSGIDAARLLQPYCDYLIFTTAHSQYALNAYGVDADAFLLKPLTLPLVMEKVEKLLEKRKPSSSDATKKEDKEYLFIKNGTKNSFVRIAYNDIVCIDAGDHYPTIVTRADRITTYMTLKNLEQHLANHKNFIRIHKSCIISMDYISDIDGNTVYLQAAERLGRSIGESYQKTFFDHVSEYSISPNRK